jgi:hypothetical protein
MDRRETPLGLTVELHGWLSQEVIGEFEKLCDSAPGPLCLGLSHLVGADEAGLHTLRARIAAGARIEGESPYIALLLRSESPGRNPGKAVGRTSE